GGAGNGASGGDSFGATFDGAGNGAGDGEVVTPAPMTTRSRGALLTRRRTVAAPTTMTPEGAAKLVRLPRPVRPQGGARIARRGEWDARIAKFVFADAPVAARNATMRGLVSAGADSQDLHKLDELAQYLRKSPGHAWEGGRRRRRVPVSVPVRLRRA